MRGRVLNRLFLAVFVLGVVPYAVAQVSPDEAKQLELRYKDMPQRVRDLLSDSKVRYDASGKLVGKWHPGRWTWHSTVEVTNVEMKHQFLRIKGYRLLLNYNRTKNKFDALRAERVEFEIETRKNADGKIDLDKEWEKAFLAPAEEYPLEMQPYWKPFIACVINPKTAECEYYEKRVLSFDSSVNVVPAQSKPATTDNSGKASSPEFEPNYPDVYAVRKGNGVTPPKVRSQVEPVYNDVARKARVTGTVLLEAIVTKKGQIRITRVIRPIGYGLEENAAEALSRWTFQPAMRMGQPVDVLLSIEINFRLQ